jgi:two-component sensor histidine kinase/PAS domain-containing protein
MIDAIGQTYLLTIIVDFLKLLGTSCSIYDTEGNPIISYYESDYCRFLSEVSFNNCGEENIEKATLSGKWHCYNSCWKFASYQSIRSKRTTDILCNGGMRIYAAPIFIGQEVAGSISFSYGNPPKTERELIQIANKYNIDVSVLVSYTKNYKSRPPFIINFAKSLLQSTAEKLSLVLENKISKDKLQHEKTIVETIIYTSPSAILIINPDGLITYANSKANELFQKESMLKSNFSDFIELTSIADFEGNPIPVEKLPFYIVSKSLNPLHNYEMSYVSKQKERIFLTVNTSPVLTDTGELDFIISNFFDVTNRVKNEKRIKVLLDEKEMLLKEVHHRIKNNMNSISSLLELQLSLTENKQIKDALELAINRVQTMGTLYDKLYKHENYTESSANEYFGKLTDEILNILDYENKIIVEKDISPVALSVKVIFPIGIILNELLTNSIKYGFPNKRNGNIKIHLSKTESKIKFSVSDNGIGFINQNNGKGFGLKLIKLLVDQLNGHYSINSENGVNFTLEIPLDKNDLLQNCN